MMEFSEIASVLRKRGYTEDEAKPNYRIFYEFGKLDFLYSDCAKKFEVQYDNGEVEKIVMIQYWFGKSIIKEILTLEELSEFA